MHVDLSEVFKKDGAFLNFSGETDLSDFEEGAMAALGLSRPVAVKGRAENLCGVLTVALEMNVAYKGFCARCNQPVEQEMTLQTESDILDSHFSGDFDDVAALRQNELLLSEYVYNVVAMSVPIRFLCKEDCKGLCGKCGANLNQEQCSCQAKDIDPRLAVLKELLKD